jgi:hypothetical protein
MFWKSTKFRKVAIAICAFDVVLFAAQRDWISVAIAGFIGGGFAVRLFRDRKKSDA